MHIADVRDLLDHPEQAHQRLQAWKLRDPARAHANLLRMAESGLTLDLLADLCAQLARHLPAMSDPDMALNNLERFISVARNPLALGALFERDRDALPILLQIFSTSQHLSDCLITDTESYDLLRLTEGEPVARGVLVDELCAEVTALPDERLVMRALRRYKRRETLRIAYGDIIRNQRLEVVTAQISYLADAIIEAAIRAAQRKLAATRGQPRTRDGRVARFVVLGMGKLGGVELNYSSDIDLIFLYEDEGRTDGPRPLPNVEYFDRLAREVVRYLSEPTELGAPYRVDLRLRPEGKTGPMVHSVEQALHYYDVLGRTWERQAYVKARAVAGDIDLGQEFLRQMEPWVYRRYLSLADITGIKALKRRIEDRTRREGAPQRNVKTGHGGIRDIEFCIQFLQLLNGGDLPELRTGNTLQAMAALERVGCLTHQERLLLETNYSFLRKIEHRLQIMFDLQTHELPDDEEELRKLAVRMGFQASEAFTPLQAFQEAYASATAENRRILDHLLHDAFGDDTEWAPEVDLILDPDPPAERIREVLARYGFKNPELAYKHLQGLATERIRFLSTRRCRHFLASIAPKLLAAIAATPDPDSTLVSLDQVSDSLGGKGVLWELFSFNPPTLRLYVELCATSPYLTAILTSNPGMIDELMDSLVLNKLPTLQGLRLRLADLCRAAEDLDPILHSFKNAQHLRVGVRDILGMEDISATTMALSDIAQACIEQIAATEFQKLVDKLGQPMIQRGPRAGQPCELILVALGKFGGGELNYHSDLDLIFLYEAEGHTQPRSRHTEPTTNQHFFGELGQRIIKAATHLGPYGRLYDIDARLRPTGRNGPLATSLAELERYYASGEGQLWERQALCKARVVFASPRAAEETLRIVHHAAFDHPFTHRDLDEIRRMRMRLEETAGPGNVKRGPGGIVDIEFLAQMLRLRYAGAHSQLRVPSCLAALQAARDAGLLPEEDFTFLADSYRFLRKVESRLRLMYVTARDSLPTDREELRRLAAQFGFSDGQQFLAHCQQYTQENRRRFERYFTSM
jgi:glutamate-ammonia-ligase adenylyltransferase